MNIHEYQAKALLKGYGAPVAEGVAIFSADEAEAAAKSLPGPLYVVKSQIHAGGRGKGKFKELGPDAKGGVRRGVLEDEAKAHAREMLGNTLVTKQTGDAGKQVNRLYIEDGADIAANSISRSWWIAPWAVRPSWCRPKAAWTSRRWPRKRPRRSSPWRSILRPA
jgi:succinyl-CoA synthetase beta subunit